MRGFWDGSKIMDGSSGCGIVIKGVDKERKSISKIAALLEVCALSAEVTGACMLTNILNVAFHKNVSLKILTSALTKTPEERGDAQGPTEGSDISVAVCFVVLRMSGSFPCFGRAFTGGIAGCCASRFQPQSRMMSAGSKMNMDGREEFD